MSKKVEISNFVWFGVALAVCALAAAAIVPSYMRSYGRGGNETGCKSNLKNFGTAMEMYSTDWSGKYPTKLAMLTPNYLKTIPECPVTGTASYRLVTGPGVGYNKGELQSDGTRSDPFTDYYLVWCEGSDHYRAYDTPRNYPQYDGIRGLIEY